MKLGWIIAPLAIIATAASAAVPVGVVRTLEGHWRVAGIDGRSMESSDGIALRADKRDIWWEPRCAGYVRSYRNHGVSFSTGIPGDFVRRGRSSPPPLICLIAPPREVADIFTALNAARRIGRTEGNGVELTGGGHSLLLFSQ